jgi:LysR family transcriptional activator of nhaA
MRTLNFNHLYYFWVVARAGSITAASRQLHLTQPTLSTQIKQLERALGCPLFARTGRELILTGVGQNLLRHADEMFRIAETMMSEVGDGSRGQKLIIGSSDAIPKPVVRDVLAPLRALDPPVAFECREWRIEQLLGELALERMDLLITDAPVPSIPGRPTVSALIGESQVSIYASPPLAERLRDGFPGSLSGTPMVLPARGSALRESIERWLEANQIVPEVVAEAEDRALLHYLTEGGFGSTPAAEVLETALQRQFAMERVGPVGGVRDQYYVVTLEHRLKHRGVAAVLGRSRDALTAHGGAR